MTNKNIKNKIKESYTKDSTEETNVKFKELLGFGVLKSLFPSNTLELITAEVGETKIIKAYKDLETLTNKHNKVLSYIQENQDDVYKIFIDCMYEILPREYDLCYRSMAIHLFTLKCFTIILKGYSDDETQINDFLNDLGSFIKNNGIVINILMKLYKLNLNKMATFNPWDFENPNLTKEEFEYYEKESIPIKLEKFSPELKLYHGMSLENYKDILKDGYIKRSNYANINIPDLTKDKNKSKKIKKTIAMKYKHEDKFVFLDAGLDIPVSFAAGGYRKNVLYWSREPDETELKRKNKDNRINSEGVVFIVNPEKYNVYFYMPENQFLIDSDIDINDTEVLFVRYKGGIITITDKEGNEVNNI